MEELIGILYKDEQKLFGKKVDALIDFTKFKGDNRIVNILLSLVEKKDDDIFSALIKVIDDRYADRIPVNLKPAAREVALAVINEDKESFKEHAPVLIDLLVDIPRVSDESEAYVITGVVRGIVEAFEAKL